MHRGGDGVIREYGFDAPATVTLMGERRNRGPWGLAGGDAGAAGRHLLIRDGVVTELPDKATFEVGAGDCVRIETPGGGGYGGT